MTEQTIIALDAMGGDNAPESTVKGAVEAIKKYPEVIVKLIGLKEPVEAELKKYEYDKTRLEFVECTEVVAMDDHPAMAIRRKKDSSMVVGMKMVKEGNAASFISAGNSGAVLVGGQTVIGRIRGIERPPFSPILPTAKGPVLLLDSGANVDAKPEWLVQWAKIGSVYMENQLGIKNPRVAIVNVGVEESKGNQLVKDAYPLLKEADGINFTGSIEAREISKGGADVIVTDAFVGNVILKMYEGVASTLLKEIKGVLLSSIKTKIGALLIKGSLKTALKKFDAKSYGGAPLLGCKGLVVKVHGNATETEIVNSIGQCIKFNEVHMNEKIKDALHLGTEEA